MFPKDFNVKLAYEYARGYYDGRVFGSNNPPELGSDDECLAYNLGYDSGVTDYCELDENVA